MNDESDAKEERLGMSRQAPWQATVLTLFPEMFPGLLGASLPGKGLKEGLWRLETLDIRSFARDKHASVDDTPYGGGAGMVMRPDVVDEAIGGAEAKFGPASRKI
jgi:tRNA (guanine37-N1)-methyltransferase